MIKSHQADVAQLVEQSIRNRQVIGSSPIVGSILCIRPLRGKALNWHEFSTFVRSLPLQFVDNNGNNSM
jgi:hypothetical protein